MTAGDVGPDNWRHCAASRQDRLSQKVRLYDSDRSPAAKAAVGVQNPLRNQGRTTSHVTGFRDASGAESLLGSSWSPPVATWAQLDDAMKCSVSAKKKDMKESV